MQRCLGSTNYKWQLCKPLHLVWRYVIIGTQFTYLSTLHLLLLPLLPSLLFPFSLVLSPSSSSLHLLPFIFSPSSSPLHLLPFIFSPSSSPLHPLSFTLSPSPSLPHPLSLTLSPSPSLPHPLSLTISPSPLSRLSVLLEYHKTNAVLMSAFSATLLEIKANQHLLPGYLTQDSEQCSLTEEPQPEWVCT